MDSKMSAAGLINILWCILYSFIITFQDLYSCFRRLFGILSYLLFGSWRNPYKHRSDKENILASKLGEFRDENANVVASEDVEIIMEKLGLFCNMNEHKESFEINNIVNLFDEREASLDEVREAFGVFDENKDGFIDVEELKKVMNSIGLRGFSEQECQRMIMAYDDNGDGRIDFGEFVKLMEDCYC
ncbi:hypothetical protein BUALT_Bualt02G0152100 [Buddleja alternifolia]|uniref:EF-hand domain-containing protein n=1 Tax=Buddleja alternifolia TaxID=168488 RepID=A0AAV6YBG7_9LAMI|nr:hypothetical protein BUALT_Bualt02G0152100 [Buddleja alternifolia]